MNEPVQTAYLQGRSRALGPFRDRGEGTEKKWFSTVCPSVRKSNTFQRTGHHSIHRRSSFWRVNPFTRKQDDGGGNVGVDSTSVRGPPSPGLRARTKDVAQISNGFVWGSVPTHIDSTAVGR